MSCYLCINDLWQADLVEMGAFSKSNDNGTDTCLLL